MNEKNIKLVRKVIRELAKNESIKQGTKHNVHGLYEMERPHLKGDYLDMDGWCTEHECGTAACLAGWLAMDPRVNAAGLTLRENEYGKLEPAYAGTNSMWALRRFLGFSYIGNVNHIFGAEHPNTFAPALKRLDEAVEREKELIHA